MPPSHHRREARAYQGPRPRAHGPSSPLSRRHLQHQGRQLANRADKPTLVVTAEASYHMPYDYCTVDFLRRAGCSGTRHVELADEGIRGNGYRFFVAKNSDVIQRLPEKWISAQ